MSTKSFSSVIDRFDSKLWHFHMIVPKDIVDYFQSKKIKRFICRINDQVDVYCALMPAGNETYFINVNKEVRKKLNLNIGDDVNCEIKEDNSKYGMPMPEEFIEVLATDNEGDYFFHALTPGKQRNLIYLVAKPKSQDKRIEKALIVLSHLTANQGELDFKMLNEAFKSGLM